MGTREELVAEDVPANAATTDLESKENGIRRSTGPLVQRELKELMYERLLGDEVRCHQYLRRDAIEVLVDQHMTGRVNHSYRLWNLLVLES